MTAPSHDASADAVALGALLVLLHGGDAPVNTVEVIYRFWRHRERAHAAFLADVEEQKRRGASITSYGPGEAEPEPAESEETVRIWRAGERVRVEHHGGERDGYYAVTHGPLWWMWDERNGAHSNQDDPSVGSGIGEELQIMLNPVPLLTVRCGFSRQGAPRLLVGRRSERTAFRGRTTGPRAPERPCGGR